MRSLTKLLIFYIFLLTFFIQYGVSTIFKACPTGYLDGMYFSRGFQYLYFIHFPIVLYNHIFIQNVSNDLPRSVWSGHGEAAHVAAVSLSYFSSVLVHQLSVNSLHENIVWTTLAARHA